MKVTTDHPSSRYGMPVILDDADQPLDYAPGVRAVRAALGVSTAAIAEATGKSRRTVEDWEQGRFLPTAAALNVLGVLLDRQATPARRSASD